MLKTLLLTALVAYTSAGLLPLKTDEKFAQYKLAYNKKYSSPEEEQVRLATFRQNLQFIAEHNAKYEAGEVKFTVGVNQFADWTNEEYVRWLGAPQEARFGNASTYLSPTGLGKLPESVDWRDKGYVTPVKDQGQCGSCWAFSATGALEGQHFKKTKKLVSLSEQNLVDCADEEYGNYGCGGGWPYQAYDYVKDNGGIDTEESYKYTAHDGTCKYDAKHKGATLTGYTKLPSGNEARLQEAVATIGPVSVAIDASHMSFQLYNGGIYHESRCSSSRLDHAVLAVGYGTDNGDDFWLVKNSWNTNWGMDGYIKMTRNKNNECGIATATVYPLV